MAFCAQRWLLVLQCPEFAVDLVPMFVLALVGWEGLLRPGEILRLTAGAVLITLNGVAVWSLPATKDGPLLCQDAICHHQLRLGGRLVDPAKLAKPA